MAAEVAVGAGAAVSGGVGAGVRIACVVDCGAAVGPVADSPPAHAVSAAQIATATHARAFLVKVGADSAPAAMSSPPPPPPPPLTTMSL